ncbi:hypothetical protein [uncultured Fibrobacter sp.]|nr:hypothetical protein [uncultured Fibrobacter sp.]
MMSREKGIWLVGVRRLAALQKSYEACATVFERSGRRHCEECASA